jgi:hypothetical protein
MENINISLCIPTMNRYDQFLKQYLEKYINFLQSGIISEIVICDENGNDYNKILNNFKQYIGNNFKVYKNDNVLGVLKNKIKVCALASSNYIALIDSDNFCDKDYFITVKQYILQNECKFSDAIMIAPSFAKPNFNYKKYENLIITTKNIKNYIDLPLFTTVLNTGNYILTKNIINNIKYDETILSVTTACDVLYFNLLAFQQFKNLEFHIVKDS